MEKQEMNEGMSLKEALEAIRKGLEEDKAFLRLSMLDPDPDARQAEEGRIQNVLALAGVMESWLLGEIHRTPEELIDFVSQILQDHIRGAKLRFSGDHTAP